jgi:hypothetical protein
MPRPGDAALPPAPLQLPAEIVAAPRTAGRRLWTVEGQVAVAVDGSRIWDPDVERARPAVVVRMPAHFARHLAAVLADWTTIGRLLESARGADQCELAGALKEAAGVADSLAVVRADAGGWNEPASG